MFNNVSQSIDVCIFLNMLTLIHWFYDSYGWHQYIVRMDCEYHIIGTRPIKDTCWSSGQYGNVKLG
jgi:hypothetical protein